MNRWTLLGSTMLLCLGAVLILPKLFSFQTSLEQQKATATFTPQSRVVLSPDNLVDELSSLPLTLPIVRVEWKSSILSLDLKVEGPERSVADMYQNMAEALTFSFHNTPNVDQLLLRLVAEDRWLNTRYLLLAINVSRYEWSSELTTSLQNNGDRPLTALLKQTLHVTETKLWNNQFNMQ
ncbi:hypothetical protein J2T13_004557 [Paenibacillus sp. DS2015]|uniref:hypothetical protein n=1 Tax=Paenibacillus sp. DS2015 TaxID=3373917 RepID=UPI003D1D3C02